MISRLCPVCGSELDYDEVDIGVGIQTGNYRCEICGWYPARDDEDIWKEEHTEEDLECWSVI